MIAGGPIAQLAGDPLVTGGTHIRTVYIDLNYSTYNVSAGTGMLEGIFSVIVKDGVDEYFTLTPTVLNALSNPSAAYYYTPDTLDDLRDPSADLPLDKTTSTLTLGTETSRFAESFFRESGVSQDRKFPSPRLNGY